MAYDCPAWELAADTNLLKLQRLQNKGSSHHWQFSKTHTPFNLPYVYSYITKLFRQQAAFIQNHENKYVRSTGQGKARH
jgi:hypothetical protein